MSFSPPSPVPLRTVAQATEEKRRDFLASMAARQQELSVQLTQAVDVKEGIKDPSLLEAVRRWGDGVLSCQTDDWQTYLVSRISVPPPALSPYLLLQERFSDDVWRLLAACILMSRVSSAETKERCIAAFFAHCPTPTAAVKSSPTEVEPLIKSLGLFYERFKSIVGMSAVFLGLPVFDVSTDRKSPFKIPGIGTFGYDSYLLFCCDEDIVPDDRNLKAFAAWRKKLRGESDVKQEPQ